MKISRLQHKIEAMETAFNKRVAARDLLIEQKTVEEEKIRTKSDRKLHKEKVMTLLVNTADTARDAGKQRMEKVVSKALQSVFGSDFSFEIDLDEAGGKPIANFYVVSKGENGEDVKNEPQDSRGGGINDIVAFALQASTLVVYNSPKIQGPIILDEPGKHVSEEYVMKFGEFLDFISKTFNRQIFMVTHQPHLALTADKTLVSQLVGGRTVVKEHQADAKRDESNSEEE